MCYVGKQMDPQNTKLITQAAFQTFMASGSSTGDVDIPDNQKIHRALPVDVPSLPDGYHHRHATERRIRELLVGKVESKACIVAQGSEYPE